MGQAKHRHESNNFVQHTAHPETAEYAAHQDEKEYESLVITRVFAFPREDVFDAWTSKKSLMKWWGPEGFTAPHIKIDLRVGGKYHYCTRSKDGKDYWNAGVFKEIDEPKMIVCTDYFSDERGNKVEPSEFGLDKNFPKELRVKITFDRLDNHDTKSEIKIHYFPKNKEEHDMMRKSGLIDGWNSSLDKLDDLLKDESVDEDRIM